MLRILLAVALTLAGGCAIPSRIRVMSAGDSNGAYTMIGLVWGPDTDAGRVYDYADYMGDRVGGGPAAGGRRCGSGRCRD